MQPETRMFLINKVLAEAKARIVNPISRIEAARRRKLRASMVPVPGSNEIIKKRMTTGEFRRPGGTARPVSKPKTGFVSKEKIKQRVEAGKKIGISRTPRKLKRPGEFSASPSQPPQVKQTGTVLAQQDVKQDKSEPRLPEFAPERIGLPKGDRKQRPDTDRFEAPLRDRLRDRIGSAVDRLRQRRENPKSKLGKFAADIADAIPTPFALPGERSVPARTFYGGLARDAAQNISRTFAVQQSGQLGDEAADAFNIGGGRRMGPEFGATGRKARRQQGVDNIAAGIRGTFGTKTKTKGAVDASGNPIVDPETGQQRQITVGAEMGALNPMRLFSRGAEKASARSGERALDKVEKIKKQLKDVKSNKERFTLNKRIKRLQDKAARRGQRVGEIGKERERIEDLMGTAAKSEPITFKLKGSGDTFSLEGKPIGIAGL